MPDRSSKPKRPPDLNSLAARIAQVTAEGEPEPAAEKNPAAVELGRRGGLKGGKARAAKLSSDQRREIARQAALKRWGKTASQ